ncbi:hypothetical protein [Streptomyces canus]|uniref:hypothetical protein n=1 Tax=Streptomyces canus TaxID=58343 RepID=UPI002E262D08
MNMDVSVAFNASDVKQLQAVLGPQIDANNIAALIAKIGAQEALDQAIGRGIYRAIVDQRQHRVKELILGGIDFKEAEIVVAALFKIPPSSAKRLIETTVARFDTELMGELIKAATKVLRSVRPTSGKDKGWRVVLPSALIKKWLQEELVRANELMPRSSERGSVWILPNDSYRYLCGVVDIVPRDLDGKR